MRKKTNELDVDFIGGQGKPLTKEEEQAINKYLKESKAGQEKAFSKRRSRASKTRSKQLEK
jgi:hypothetical protein